MQRYSFQSWKGKNTAKQTFAGWRAFQLWQWMEGLCLWICLGLALCTQNQRLLKIVEDQQLHAFQCPEPSLLSASIDTYIDTSFSCLTCVQNGKEHRSVANWWCQSSSFLPPTWGAIVLFCLKHFEPWSDLEMDHASCERFEFVRNRWLR